MFRSVTYFILLYNLDNFVLIVDGDLMGIDVFYMLARKIKDTMATTTILTSSNYFNYHCHNYYICHKLLKD